MGLVRFGDLVKEVKINIDRNKNPYEYYVAGDHMDSEDLTIRRRGSFATDDVGPAFTRLFKPGQILYGSRRTYLKKVAVADFEGICSNTTFVLETKDESILRQRLLPFIMLTDDFTKWSISKSKGSTNPYILFSDLANYEFDLPDISRQDELVKLLWQAYETKESYKEMIRATDEMVKSQFIEQFGTSDSNYNGYSVVPFSEMCYDDTKSATKIPADDYKKSGTYAIFDQSTQNHIAGYYDAEQGVNIDYPAILFGDHSRVFKYIQQPFFIGADGVKIIRLKTKEDPEFVFYELLYSHIPNTGYNRHFKWVKELSLRIVEPQEQQRFLRLAHQADKSKFELKQAIDKIDKVMRALMQ